MQTYLKAGLPNFNLFEVLNNAKIFKLSNSQALSLEGSITPDKIGNALKKMKNNKTPGMDGFPAKVLRYFGIN